MTLDKITFTFFCILHAWNNAICILCHWLSVAQHYACEIHPYCSFSSLYGILVVFSPPFYTDGHVGVLFTFVLWPTVLQRTSKNMPVDDFMHTFMLHTYLDVELPGHNDSQFSKCCHQFTFPLIIYEKSTYFALSTLFFFFFIPYLIVVILVGVNSYHFNLYLSID